MARRGYDSDVSVDRYGDRDDRTYVSRGGGGGRRYEDRVFEEDVYRSHGPPVREREVRVREEIVERERPAPPPAFLREEYGRTAAGPVVLRKREVEDFEFAPRRRSPSPEPERKVEKEEIIIRRDESESRPPPRRREPSREREEIIIRRDERDSRDDLRPRRDEREREEIIIRRDEKERDRGFGPPREEKEREEIIIRRDERKDDDLVSRRGGGGRGDFEREEIIIRRDERESDDRLSRGDRDRYALTRPISHERERSRHHGSDDEQEIIIRRDQREGGRGGDREREEIIIRHRSRSNSPSSLSMSGRYPPPAPYPPVGYPTPVIQVPSREDAISRAIDRDYEITLTPRRPISRPPSPPSPPRERERSAERIAIHRSGERNGREFNEDIVIDRNDTRSRSPLPPPGPRDPYYDYPPRPAPPIAGPLVPHRGYDRGAEEEAAYYNDIAKQRGYIGEGYNGSTRDWSLVDVPPGTRRVRMDGAGGGEQEITWQRYNGVRRSKFYADGASDEGYSSEVGRPMPLPGAGSGLGPSYGRPRDPRDGLWTEITKDLVTKEALKEMGYEYEETDDFFYVFKYLSYEDMARLVGLSDEIKGARHKRIKEMGWENKVLPEPIEEPTPRLAIEGPRERRDHPPWASDDERYIEREIVYRGGRPPPPPGWRR